jgi:hypothetical protein
MTAVYERGVAVALVTIALHVVPPLQLVTTVAPYRM